MKRIIQLALLLLLLQTQLFADVPNSSGICTDGSCTTCFNGTCGNNQACDSKCQCLSRYIRDNDGEEIIPDSNISKDDSSKFKTTIEDAETFVLNPNETENIALVDVYHKTLKEMFEAEYARLNGGEKWLYQALLENYSWNKRLSPPKYIPNRLDGVPVLDDLISSGRMRGVYKITYFSFPSYYYLLELGKKNCYYRTYSHTNHLGSTYQIQELLACVPKTWLGGAPKTQLYAYLEKPWGTGGLDFVVGVLPFLGTADLVYNSFDELKKGDLKAWGAACGSAAGDVWVFGKIGAAIKGSANVGKAWHVGSFVAGCSSVGLTGTHLISEYKNEEWDGENWGQATFLAIEVIGLLTDRTAKQIIAQSVQKKVIRQTLPKSACQCSKCASQTTELVRIAKSTVGDLVHKFRNFCSVCLKKVKGKIRILKRFEDSPDVSIRKPGRVMKTGESNQIGPDEGLQTSTGEKFDIPDGYDVDFDPADPTNAEILKDNKYLWVIDKDGLKIVRENQEYLAAIERKQPSHTNLTGGCDAYSAGEVWFMGNGKVRLNAASRAYGQGHDTMPLTELEYQLSVDLWEEIGYSVEVVPLGQR